MTEPITPCTCITAHDRMACIGWCKAEKKEAEPKTKLARAWLTAPLRALTTKRRRRTTMEPDVIADLIEAAERYYDSTFDLNEAEKAHRDVERDVSANPHEIAHALCCLWSQKGESLRAAGSLLHAVEAYRDKMHSGAYQAMDAATQRRVEAIEGDE